MKKYHIEMEVVTPLSIGAGNDNEWAPGADFVQRDNKVYVLDIQEVMKQGVNVEAISSLFLRSDENGICRLLGNKLEKCSKYIFHSPVSTSNPIKAFLRTQFYDLPIVAGSSLKGAIRSTLFKHFRSANERDNISVFGEMKFGTDFMRFIQVSDFELPSTILVNTKLFNLMKKDGEWVGGWKHGRNETGHNYRPTGFNTLYECVEPKVKGYGTIIFEDNAYNLLLHSGGGNISHADKKNRLMRGGVQDLFAIINTATREYLRKERVFFTTYTADRSEELIDCIDELLALIPADNSTCLIKMSAGVGFHSITGDWIYNDYTHTGTWERGRDAGKQKYKSRKTAEYHRKLKLMGFVKLRCMEKTEADIVEEQLKTERLAIISNGRKPLVEREPDRILTDDERAKRDASSKEIQLKEEYNRIMEEAQALYGKNRWEEAIAKAKEAEVLKPGTSDCQSFIEECNQLIKAEELKKRQREDGELKFKQPLVELLKGKSSVGNIIGTTSKWIKKGNAFGEVEFQVLFGSLNNLSVNEIKKKWKDLERVLPKEWNDKLKSNLNIL